jgi:hypothetical protein
MVMSKWPTRMEGGATVWRGTVASAGMAVAGMEAVVVAIADRINRDRHRSLLKCRLARPFWALLPGRSFSRRPIS